jgi:hypothetical protein
MTFNHKIPNLIKTLYIHFLKIFIFNYSHTQSWKPIPTQADTLPNVALRHEARRVFQEEDDAWAAGMLCRGTSSLYCRLRARATCGSHTCGTFHVVS